MADAVDGFLAAVAPERQPEAEAVAHMVERIAAEPDITQVADLARKLCVGARQLERLFTHYVGVSPKWVIRLYRLHEAAERLTRLPCEPGTQAGTLAQLAADLGYSDQAHFTRDFRSAAGRPPAKYATECRGAPC